MKLRILFVTTGLGTGGAERMLLKLLESLVRRGVECRTVSLRDAGTQGAAIRALGIELDELRLNRVGGLCLAPFVIARAMRRFEPHVVQGWMYHGNLVATVAWLFGRHRCRLFWGIRQTLYDLSSERWLTRQVIRSGAICSRLAQRLIYNCSLSVEQHAAVGYAGDRAIVIPNGFDLARFRPDPAQRDRTRAELGIAPQTPVVGVVARDHPMKDHATLVDAALLIRRDNPGVVFVLAGSGIDDKNAGLAGRISRSGLERNFLLLGELSDTEKLYPAMDVCALSSCWGEAFPNVLGEAMACGVPCVATDLGEARRILGDSGIVVSPRDPAAMAEAILRLLSLDEASRRELGERARQRVARLFPLDAVCDAYLEQYRASLRSQPC